MNKSLSYPTAEVFTPVELLRWRAIHQPNRRVYTFLMDGEMEEVHLTYRELDRQARAIAARLQSLGAMRERVLLFYPPGLEYIAAFFGCLYAGAIAVPAYPPRLNRPDPRILNIVVDAQPKVVLTTAGILSSGGERRFAQLPELKDLHWLATENIADDLAETWRDPAVNGNTLAFLQYTSGSTAVPKGVMLSHSNLLHNLALIQQRFEITPDSRGLFWLPPYHDMGLIGGILEPFYAGASVTLMSPLAFLQRPLRWLQGISRIRASINGGPNFAYDLCVSKITPEQRASLDLSCWDVAFTGAEPIRLETLERFAEAFAPCGFRWEAFYPTYGLAEATLMVTGGRRTAPPVVHTVQAAALEQNRVITDSVEDGDGRTLIGCGQTSPDQKIAIVDPESLTRCLPGQVGEIWVSGPSVAPGYWNRPEETEYTIQAYLADTGEGPFLRTGDLGFLKDGELFITSRLKDLIIIDGRNHYPQDIELTVEQSHPALRPGYCAAFSIDVDGEERLVVVAEVSRRYQPAHHRLPLDVKAVVKAIRRAVAEHHDLRVYDVLLLKVGSIPKTSSGKTQRYACRAGFLARTLDVLEEKNGASASQR